MGRSSLGRVLDPSALDACPGPRARLRVAVPAAWLAEGALLRIAAPPRLACARCDGGGCDACARSGALRTPADAIARVLHVGLPSAARDDGAVVLRISRPFGADHAIHQLLLEVCVAEVSSSFVARIAPAPPDAPAPIVRMPSSIPWPIVAVAVVATIVLALLGR